MTGAFKTGVTVRLRRQAEVRCHMVDTDAGLRKRAGAVLALRSFADEDQEREWVAAEAVKDVKSGLKPEDIMITGVMGEDDKYHFNDLAKRLEGEGVKAWRPGSDQQSTDFRRSGCVTVANIFRAKGNEAWNVYATRMHYATRPLAWKQETEVHKRNQAFVALTRARIWCVATGLAQSAVLDELQRVLATAPELVFPAFTRATLRRIMDEEDG